MKLEKLEVNQVRQIYKDRMVYDFSSDELRPLERILNPIVQGVYECLGLYDDAAMLGYVFLVKKDKDYFVDYLDSGGVEDAEYINTKLAKYSQGGKGFFGGSIGEYVIFI